MSQKELAGKLGVSQSAVTNWIKGKNSPDIEFVTQICGFLDISLNDFFGVKDENEYPDTKQKLSEQYHCKPEFMCFQKRFDALFKESKLSQEEFGKLLGATKNQIYNWRAGTGEPDTKNLVNIAQKCDVSVEWLLGCSAVRAPKNHGEEKLELLLEKVMDSVDELKIELRKFQKRDKA